LSHEFPVCSDDILHSDTVISDAAVKQALLQRTGASAVDMESGTVADVASTAGVPFLVLRAVADPAAHGVPAVALSALDADGGLDRKALLQRLASSPSELRSLLRLMLQFRRAARTLRQAMALGAELLLRERDPADGSAAAQDSQTAAGANS
jgi:adenosylhomocysteine nucleosidase